MDSYQRYQLELPQETECYECGDDSPTLPFEILKAAHEGNVAVIKDYLAEDGNVNALHEEECLLSRACALGHVEIVKLLLQCPDVHLNIKMEGATPLNRAARSGHMECVKLLVNATVACNIQLDNSWKTIAKYLATQPQLEPRTAIHILRSASRKGFCDILKLVLESKNHFIKEDLYHAVLVAVNQNRWDIVYSVFKRNFYGKAEIINEVFAIALNMRNWEKVQEVIKFIDADLKFDVSFIEAAISGDHPEVQKLLADGKYDSQTLNGNLLVVAAAGINDSVAESVMSVKDTYTKKTLSGALFLSALGCCSEMVSRLLHNPEASYSLNDMHQANEVLTRLPRYEKREGFLVNYFSDYFKKFQEKKA